MMDYQSGTHSIYDIKYHIIWVTKYRYQILKGEVALRAREIIRQTCMSRDVTIVQGSVGKDHVHMLVSAPPTIAPAKLVQYIKGRSSRLLQEEFPHLQKRYWGQHMWGRGYFCTTVGTVTEETIRTYIENQRIEDGKENFKVSDEFQS
jgi:putative transposase